MLTNIWKLKSSASLIRRLHDFMLSRSRNKGAIKFPCLAEFTAKHCRLRDPVQFESSTKRVVES